MLGWLVFGIAIFQAVVAAAGAGHVAWMAAEGGALESAHFVLPALSAVGFWMLGARSPAARSLYRILACACVFVAGRELDLFFELHVVEHGYFAITGPAALYAMTLAVGDREAVVEAARRFAATPAFGVLAVAAFVMLAFAQIVGQGDLWRAVMAPEYRRVVKDMVEELSELLAYVLLVIGCAESWLAEIAGRGAGGDRR